MKTPLDCIMERENNPQIIGQYVNLKTRMSAGDAHYAGELVEGAHIVTAWGDVGTELALMKVLPEDRWTEAHHSFIFHGRNCCSARNPKCESCVISDLCKKAGVK